MSLSTANHRERLISQGKEVYNAAVFLEGGRSGYWWKDVCPPYLPCVTVLQRGKDSFGLINLGKIVFRKPSSLLSAYSPCVGFLYFAELRHSGRCHHNTSNSLVEFRADLWQVSVDCQGMEHGMKSEGRKPTCQANSSVPGMAPDTVFLGSHLRFPTTLQGPYHYPHLTMEKTGHLA